MAIKIVCGNHLKFIIKKEFDWMILPRNEKVFKSNRYQNDKDKIK